MVLARRKGGCWIFLMVMRRVRGGGWFGVRGSLRCVALSAVGGDGDEADGDGWTDGLQLTYGNQRVLSATQYGARCSNGCLRTGRRLHRCSYRFGVCFVTSQQMKAQDGKCLGDQRIISILRQAWHYYNPLSNNPAGRRE